MTELTEKLMGVYGKRNTARLIRTAYNLDRARYNEEAKISETGKIYLPEYRKEYYSHKRLVLETILRDRGVDLDHAYYMPPLKKATEVTCRILRKNNHG